MTGARLDRAVQPGLLLVAVATAAMVATGYVGPARPAAALVTAALLPGAAVLAWLPRRDPMAWLALACAFSLAIETVCALAMVWLRLWHPAVAASGIGLASAAALVTRLWLDARQSGGQTGAGTRAGTGAGAGLGEGSEGPP
ncbi:hypothetical protein CC117_06310 [Parafrankia colletiae]|uniref:Uncharacterized protein n=1 Tax=Parafrankia colletiae TaxID=573497 RepID=A0A1S1Q6Q9_9ACTN|nr:hypothetical protein [Parafrankia colletiae]MCK9901045.1 hypothetical protein [Frankia sp. Cpl3]OHV30553.1 hypothetical protein CC117_06310 [Parafrankia colletiae]